MANIEGILFNDLFIDNKDLFVDFFKEYYIQHEAELTPIITNLNAVLTQYTTKSVTKEMANSFSAAWHEFQTKVLLNTGDLELIVAYRGDKGRDGVFSQIIRQADVEGVNTTGIGASYGIKAGDNLIKDSMEAIKASQVEKFLQLHLNGFLNQLDQHISSKVAHTLHLYHTACLTQYYQDNDEAHLTGQYWHNAFYGQSSGHYFGGWGLGQAYDAYMNHMANKETGIYNYLRSSGASGLNMEHIVLDEKKSVYVEENKIGPNGNFPNLLAASRNHTGWYTGGDIVIVNPQTLSIVYNIQLKTTTANKASVFAERVADIRTFINQFIAVPPEQKGNILFNFMLTSVSNSDAFNALPQETADEIIKDAFKSILTT